MDILTIKRLKGQTKIQLAANLSISEAENLYKGLAKVFKRKPPLVLDASKVERVDTASIQVLACFCHSAHERDIELSWHKPSINFCRAAELAGLNTVLGMPH